MARKRFLRHKWRKYSKLGKGRNKLLKYRRPRGRHNKMREKRKGNAVAVRIGYKKSEKTKKEIKVIVNINELKTGLKGSKVVLGRIGKKKKIEIAKKAKEMGIKIDNLNLDKFLDKIRAEKARKAREKAKRETRKEKKKTEEKKSSLEKTSEKMAKAKEKEEKDQKDNSTHENKEKISEEKK